MDVSEDAPFEALAGGHSGCPSHGTQEPSRSSTIEVSPLLVATGVTPDIADMLVTVVGALSSLSSGQAANVLTADSPAALWPCGSCTLNNPFSVLDAKAACANIAHFRPPSTPFCMTSTTSSSILLVIWESLRSPSPFGRTLSSSTCQPFSRLNGNPWTTSMLSITAWC